MNLFYKSSPTHNTEKLRPSPPPTLDQNYLFFITYWIVPQLYWLLALTTCRRTDLLSFVLILFISFFFLNGGSGSKQNLILHNFTGSYGTSEPAYKILAPVPILINIGTGAYILTYLWFLLRSNYTFCKLCLNYHQNYV